VGMSPNPKEKALSKIKKIGARIESRPRLKLGKSMDVTSQARPSRLWVCYRA
jgi:hypothetical protein